MNKFFRFTIIVLMLFIVFVTGCSKDISEKLTNTTKALKFEDIKFENIKSARIELARSGGLPIKNYTFDFNNSDHTKIIEDVIGYLNSGKVQGIADEKVTNKGNSPTLLILQLKDGSVVQIKSAVGGKVTNTEISQFDIPNEVTISSNSNEKPIRILSTELRKFIDTDYKGVFKVN